MGGLAIVLLAWSVAATAVLSRLMDGTIQRESLDGRRYLESAGTSGRLLAASVLLLAVAVAAIAIVQGVLKLIQHKGPVYRSGYSLLIVVLILWWSLCMVLVREEALDLQSIFEIVAAIVIVIAAIMSPPTLKTVMSLVHLMNVFALASLAYAFTNPAQQLVCRVDKCGIFNTLFTGFFYQENGAARVIVLLVPAAAVIRSRLYLLVTLAIATVYVAATGSRTSLLTLAIAILVVLVVRRRVLGKSAATTIPWPLRFAPLGALAVSFYLLYEADNRAFTGRGEIYAGIRNQLQGTAFFFGSGSDTVAGLRLAYNALAFGEHGQAPHLMVRAGIVGVILFALAMLAIARQKKWTATQAVGFSFLFIAATQFATEPAWELELRTMSCVLMILTAGLLARTTPAPKKADRETLLREATIKRLVHQR